MAKIKSRVSLVRSAQHNTRERQPANADAGRINENIITGSVEDIMTKYSELLPEKVRKNAVHAIEVLMTASPDFQGNWQRYLNDCTKWVKNTFGESNVLHIAHHHDEMTPHTHVLVMPLKDGKLNAKHFIGGTRDRMGELQDDFFKQVGRINNLERGEKREITGRRHDRPQLEKGLEAELKAVQKERQQLATIQETMAKELGGKGSKPQELPPVGLLESGKSYRNRIGDFVTGMRLIYHQQITKAQEERTAAIREKKRYEKAADAAETLYNKLSKECGGFSTYRAWFEERERRQIAARNQQQEKQQKKGIER